LFLANNGIEAKRLINGYAMFKIDRQETALWCRLRQ